MENLAPPLQVVIFLRRGLGAGQSLRQVMAEMQKISANLDVLELCAWFFQPQSEEAQAEIPRWTRRPEREAVIDILRRAQKGEAILEAIEKLEILLIEVCERELEESLATLPFRALVPLLLFQFPALLLILLGPLVAMLVREL